MAQTAKVGSSPSASVTSAPSRVAMGSRYSSAERIEGSSGPASIGLDGHWRPGYDTDFEGGSDQYPPNTSQTPLFSSLVKPAVPTSESAADVRTPTNFFLTDLQRAVGIYEFNMKIFAGGASSQGSIVNRYS